NLAGVRLPGSKSKCRHPVAAGEVEESHGRY
ncbi:MAG: hypothetical protein ACI80K_002715, partial [Paracoccaceae bacterium]